MKKTYVTISQTVTYLLPSHPNFIRIQGIDSHVSIADIDDASLRQIGDAWTKQLIELAKQKRKSK